MDPFPASGRARAGPWWESPAHGLHVPTGSVNHLPDLCAALATVLPPGSAWTHLTGAALRGWALPDKVDLDIPLIASAGAPAPHRDRRGVYVRRARLDRRDVDEVDGVAVACAAQLVREVAEDLTLVDLIVLIDSAIFVGDLVPTELERIPRGRRRGCRVLRQALALVDGRSESAWETLLRLVHVLSALPDVEPQRILTGRFGEELARADLWLRGTRRIHEYDGADHVETSRQRRDRARDNDLARNRYDRRGYTRPDITVHAGRIVRDAEDAWGFEHDPRRVQGWLSEFRRPSYSAYGQRRLQDRLARFRRPDPPRSRSRLPRRVAQDDPPRSRAPRRVAQDNPLGRRVADRIAPLDDDG